MQKATRKWKWRKWCKMVQKWFPNRNGELDRRQRRERRRKPKLLAVQGSSLTWLPICASFHFLGAVASCHSPLLIGEMFKCRTIGEGEQSWMQAVGIIFHVQIPFNIVQIRQADFHISIRSSRPAVVQ